MSVRALLVEGAAAMEIPLSDPEIDALLLYKAELMRWNSTVNLTGLEDESAIIEKHFLDSLACWLGGWIEGGDRVIDIGTGAGFPGLVVKITSSRLSPEVEVSLVESSSRKVRFLEHLCGLLSLSRTVTVNGRVEDLGRREGYRECFDVAVSRAVAGLPTVSEYCLPLVRRGGWFLAMKGARAEDEARQGESAIKALGGQIAGLSWYTLPYCRQRRAIVAVRKVLDTPARFPRRTGIPAKRPLL